MEKIMSLYVLVESIPIILALYALLKLSMLQRNNIEIILCKILAILMIICQSTWVQIYMTGLSAVLPIIDKFWIGFNILSMVLILLIANRNKS
jgi:hypothetical protein